MSAFKFNKAMDKTQIVEAIRSIEGRGKKLDNDIQLTGLSVLAHIAKHGEVSLFIKLFNAMPQGSRRNALVAWAVDLGQVSVNMDKDTKKEFPFLFNKEGTTNLEGAEKYPWYSYKPEAAPSEAFNFDKWLAKAHELLNAKVKAGTINPASDRRLQILLSLSPEVSAPVAEVANDDTVTGLSAQLAATA